MGRNKGAWAAVAVLSALAAGCSTRTQVRNAAADAGVLRSFAAPFAAVQNAARTAFQEESLPVSEERWLDRSRWSLLSSPSGGLSVYRVARVVVEDHPTDCRVWILVQNKPDLVEEAAAEVLQNRIARLLGLESRTGPSPSAGAGEREARYRSSLGRCSELTSRACRTRGYAIVRQEDGDAALRTITAERKPSRRLFAALYRQSDEVTRVVVEVRGGAPDENQQDASAVHEELLKELQPEP